MNDMTVQTFDVAEIKHDVVSVSQEAAAHFEKQIKKTQSAGIRLSLKQAGCTGFKYVVDEVESAQDTDLDVALENGVHLYIDNNYINAIRGTQIDVKKQGLNFNLILENPNVKDECGCGESFSIEDFEQES